MSQMKSKKEEKSMMIVNVIVTVIAGLNLNLESRF